MVSKPHPYGPIQAKRDGLDWDFEFGMDILEFGDRKIEPRGEVADHELRRRRLANAQVHVQYALDSTNKALEHVVAAGSPTATGHLTSALLFLQDAAKTIEGDIAAMNQPRGDE